MIPVAKIARALASLSFLFVMVSGGAVTANAQAKFGDQPSFASASTDNFDYSVSADKQAFTIVFKTAFEATVGNLQNAKVTDAPIGTQIFSAVIPVSGGDIDTTFFVTTFVAAEQGAAGTLLFAVNDKNTVMRFPPGDGKEVIVKLNYKAKTASDVRLTLFLLAERDAAHPKASALVHVNAIDTDLALAKQHGNKK